MRQSIIHSGICNLGCMNLLINTSDMDAMSKHDAAIANRYGNKFVIPLGLKLLDSTIPYCQLGSGNRLCYKIMLNNYNRVIISPLSPAKPVPQVQHGRSPLINMQTSVFLPLWDNHVLHGHKILHIESFSAKQSENLVRIAKFFE